MNDMLDPNKMVEATRLTRAGRLAEAAALLQRMLRAEPPPDMTFDTAGDIVPTGREPPIIDATAKSEETDRPPSSRFGIDSRPAGRPFASAVTAAQRAHVPRLSALFGSDVQAPGSDCAAWCSPPPCPRRTSCRRADSSLRRRTATQREPVLTNCTYLAAITGRRSLWSSCCTAALSRLTISPPARA